MAAWNISLLPRFEIRTGNGQSVSLRSRQYAEFLAILALAGPGGIELRTIGTEFFTADWSDQKTAIRNLVSRTRGHLASYSDIELIVRDSEFVSLVSANCYCDLWQLRREIAKSPSDIDANEVERLLQSVTGHIFGAEFCSLVATTLLKQLADDLLRGIELLASRSSGPRLRSLAVNIISAIKPVIQFSTDLTERQLALYGKLRMRQEIIETLADYSDFLADDLGDSVDRQLERFAESLLLELDRSDTTQFDVPGRPASSADEGVQLQAAKAAILEHQLVYIGGLTGVGKSHLLRLLGNTEEVSELNPAFIDLTEQARPIATGVLVARNPQVVFLDHYVAGDAEEVERVRLACPEAKIVVAGNTDLGLKVNHRITVMPWAIDVTDYSQSAETLVRRILAPRSLRPQQIKEIARVANGLPGAVVKLVALIDEFGVDLAIHEFSERNQRGASDWVHLEVLLENLKQMSAACQAAIKALAGFGHPVAGVSLASCFQLTVEELRRLVSLGLLEFRKGDEAFAIPSMVCEYLRQFAEFEPANSAQIQFEEWLADKLSRTLPAEANHWDISGLQQVIQNCIRRKDFDRALSNLVTLRPHLFVLRSCDIDLTGLDDQLDNLRPEADRCVKALLAIGSGLFYQLNYQGVVSLLEDGRWESSLSAAASQLKAEFYSQLGLAKSKVGDRQGGIETLQRAAEMSTGAGLEPILVKVLYNLATTLAIQGQRAQAAHYLDRAVDLLPNVPTIAGRLELLHMRASYHSDLGGSLYEVKQRFHVALSYAKSNGLDEEAGWIMLSLGGHFVQRGELLQAIVAFSTGLREQLSAELSPEVRCRCSFSCDSIAFCLNELGSTALACQGAVLALDTMGDYVSRDSGFDRLGIKPIQLPEGLRKAKGLATGGDILLYLSRVQQFLRQFPDSQAILSEFGYFEGLSAMEPTGV